MSPCHSPRAPAVAECVELPRIVFVHNQPSWMRPTRAPNPALANPLVRRRMYAPRFTAGAGAGVVFVSSMSK